MSILAVSGDVGGARAVIRVLHRMEERGIKFKVLKHRGLTEAPRHWDSIAFNKLDDIEKINKYEISTLLFSSSVKDDLPLRLAAKAKELGIPIVFLLDNWMNYRSRLELDGNLVLPDRYLLMDELAFEGAIAEGLPKRIIRITGQPVLADIKKDYQSIDNVQREEKIKSLGLDAGKRLLIFVSEPAEMDQGADNSNPKFRGYTEKTVLAELCRQLQPFSNDFQLAILPHPREEIEGLMRVWKRNAGSLSGGIFSFESGREAIFLADGVCGMASLLLQEAWFLNKPVMSIQPGVLKSDLTSLNRRHGLLCLTDNSQWGMLLNTWLKQTSDRVERLTKEELDFHLGAADRIVDIILEQCG